MRFLQHQSSTHKLASDLRCLRAVSGIVCSWLSPRNLGKEERRGKADVGLYGAIQIYPTVVCKTLMPLATDVT